MFDHADVLHLAAAGIDLDGIELLDRMGVAQDYRPDVYRHYVIHDNRCPAATTASDACDCGLIAVFGSDRAMVIVDCQHVAEVHSLN
jgi:hypothetical protein